MTLTGEWSDWTESACGEIVSGEITQHRTCEGGAYCEGESIKCARRCDGARTYGMSELVGVELNIQGKDAIWYLCQLS